MFRETKEDFLFWIGVNNGKDMTSHPMYPKLKLTKSDFIKQIKALSKFGLDKESIKKIIKAAKKSKI